MFPASGAHPPGYPPPAGFRSAYKCLESPCLFLFQRTIVFRANRCWSRAPPSSLGGDGKVKGRTLPRLGFHPDPAAHAFDDFFADAQPDAGARILGPGMQALEDHENSLAVLRFDANAVVVHREDPLALCLPGAHVDPGRLLAAK